MPNPDLRFDDKVAESAADEFVLPHVRSTITRAWKRAGIEGYGLSIEERVPLEIQPNDKNREYLRTKKEKLGHVLHLMS